MAVLEMTGTLNRSSNPSAYEWKTDDGVEVAISARQVKVRWPGVDDQPDNWARMRTLIEAPLLASVLSSAHPATVVWTQRVVEDGEWRRVVAGLPLDAVLDAPLPRLDQPTPELNALDASLPLVVATELFSEGLDEMQADNLLAAMRSFYLAAEAVVDAIRGASFEEDWVEAARQLGVGPEKGRQLYLSLQIARHINASHAERKLIGLGLKRLSAPYCRGLTHTLLRAYGQSLIHLD